MFEDSLVESTHRIRTQSRWPLVISIGLQAVLAALIVVIPLMHPETLQRLALSPPMLISPPAPVPPPPPPRVLMTSAEASSGPSMPAIPQLVTATAHSIVDRIMRAQSGLDAPPGVIVNSSMMGSGDSASMIPGLGTGDGRPSVAVAAPSRVRLSSGVSAGMLVEPIRPVYPPIAKAAHMEGTVVIHAIISKTGCLESASVVSGPVMLQGAAIDAVRAARYKPFRLNGEPTEVDTTINIVFRLSS